MMSFWGSSKKDNQAQPQESTSDNDGPPADETTRLLPNRLDSSAPYLSPDDPAVSPYNLWSVRFVRYITVALTIVTFLWWTALLVSAFVTPPGLHARGSTFLAFSYSSVALVELIVILLFFAAPSTSAKVIAIIITVVLFIDTIITVSVEQTRHEELWVGVASAIWALAISVWTLFVERTVQWGKTEEEERLTGRPETRRTLFEWTEVLFSTIALIILAVTGVLLTFNLILRSLDASLAPLGTKYWVDGDKYQLHLYCHGAKSDPLGKVVPTVLFEGGEVPVENGLWQFADNALKNGSISRYCFADRPGLAWSDNAPSPMSAGMATDVLSEALAQAGESGPWVLVSAGIGSIYSRVFASRHGSDILGLLMIDPMHEDLLYRVAKPGRGVLLWLKGIISPLGLERLSGAVVRGRNKVDRVWGRSSSQSSKSVFAKLQESLVADSLTKREVISSRAIQDPKTAVILISSGLELRGDNEWSDKQEDLSHLTLNVRHWDVVDQAPHHVWETLEGREVIEKRLRKLVLA